MEYHFITTPVPNEPELLQKVSNEQTNLSETKHGQLFRPKMNLKQ